VQNKLWKATENQVFVLIFDPDVPNTKPECFHLDDVTMPINIALVMLHVAVYRFAQITLHECVTSFLKKVINI